MKDSERMVFNWLVDQGFSEEKIHRVSQKSPDFILEMGNEKRVYVEATECGWLNSRMEDERGIRSDLRNIVRDEVKNVRESGGLPERCWIGVRVDWPYVFIPTRKRIESRKKIRKKIQEYGEHLKSCCNNIIDHSAFRKRFVSFDSSNVDAEFSFWKRKTGREGDCICIDVCEENKGSLETSRYVSTIRNALRKKTTEKVKCRTDEFSEYWLVLVDRSFMLAGDDHKPDAEDWRRRDWDVAREDINEDSNLEYWDRIEVISDYNDGLVLFQRL